MNPVNTTTSSGLKKQASERSGIPNSLLGEQARACYKNVFSARVHSGQQEENQC